MCWFSLYIKKQQNVSVMIREFDGWQQGVCFPHTGGTAWEVCENIMET